MVFLTVMKLKLTLILFFLSFYLSAHPHVFIDYSIDFEISNAAVNGFWINWDFDEFVSSTIIYGYDMDEDGEFSPEENYYIFNEYFNNLKKYGYYIRLQINGNNKGVTRVSDFKASMNKGVVSYRFYVELEESFEEKDLDISLFIFDTTYFTALATKEEKPVTAEIPPTADGSYSVNKDETTPYYYDPYAPPSVTLDTSKPQPGWLTAYPDRVNLKVKYK